MFDPGAQHGATLERSTFLRMGAVRNCACAMCGAALGCRGCGGAAWGVGGAARRTLGPQRRPCGVAGVMECVCGGSTEAGGRGSGLREEAARLRPCWRGALWCRVAVGVA